jgi:hypothetical protein
VFKIEARIFQSEDEYHCEFVVDEPSRAEIILSCKYEPFPKYWGEYIWSFKDNGGITHKECIEQITGLKVKRIVNYQSGNGHGGFEVEYE